MNDPNFWVGRLSIEIAVALMALEAGNEEIARAGLRECLDDFADSPAASQELIDYLDDMQRERQQTQPQAHSTKPPLTNAEIARRM